MGLFTAAIGCDPKAYALTVPHLVCELLNEDEGANEDVAGGNILLELLVVLGVTELLEEVAHHLIAHILVGGVDVVDGRRESRLVLRLQHSVHNLHHHAAISLRDNTASLWVDVCVAAAHHTACPQSMMGTHFPQQWTLRECTEKQLSGAGMQVQVQLKWGEADKGGGSW